MNSVKGEGPAVKDMMEAGIFDPYLVKNWAIKLATNAAITVLRVDQVSHLLNIYLFIFVQLSLLHQIKALDQDFFWIMM